MTCGSVGQRVGDERARVGALDHGDPGIGPQAPGELAVGDVEGDDVRGAGREQAVGEAARRGADVEAAGPGNVQARRRRARSRA